MTHPFRDSYLKLARAKAHVAELEQLEADWSANAKFGEEIGPGQSPMSTRSAPVPEDVTAIVGDAIHNMRAALDLMAVALVRNRNANTKNVYFPFAENAADLRQRIKDRNFHRAGPEAVALLEKIAPYAGGNAALRAMHDLDIQDKHHSLVIHKISITSITMRVVIEGDGPIRLVPEGPDNRPKTRLTFPEDSVFAEEEIVPVLHRLVELTASILKAFEALCEVPGVDVDTAGAHDANADALPESPEAPKPEAP